MRWGTSWPALDSRLRKAVSRLSVLAREANMRFDYWILANDQPFVWSHRAASRLL
jgi:hypothetical protein